MKHKVHFRGPWSFVELRMDGMKPKERLKGNLKKIYQRKTRSKLKKEALNEIKLEANDNDCKPRQKGFLRKKVVQSSP